MRKVVLSAVLASLLITVAAVAQAEVKSINHNGIECAAPTASGNWVPSTPGLYGFEPGFILCPVSQAVSEGYSANHLSYAFMYGINLSNPRLCKRSSSGAVTCGTNYALTSDTWILYAPAGGDPYDVAFVSTNTGSGISLTKYYTVVWAY